MKITFFIGGMHRGGAERVISILANHYASKGWDVDIVALLYSGVDYELDNRVRIVEIIHSGSYIKGLRKWLKQIRRYVKREKPDRVVSFIGRINVLIRIALIGLNVPIIASERNDPRQDGRGKLMLWLCNQCYKHVSAVVFQNKYERSCFSKKIETKSHIIPNPVHVACSQQEPIGCRIVTAGRLLPQKNHKMLIEAFSIVQKHKTQATLEIYGDGILHDELQNQINELGLSNSVTLCGNVSDLHERIATAAVFVMTSEYEGQSNALLEAMMLGLPCISTDYPGVEEIITNGDNGLIVPRGDSTRLSEAIIQLIDDQNLNKSIRINSIRTANAFKKETVLTLWEKVINGEI